MVFVHVEVCQKYDVVDALFRCVYMVFGMLLVHVEGCKNSHETCGWVLLSLGGKDSSSSWWITCVHVVLHLLEGNFWLGLFGVVAGPAFLGEKASGGKVDGTTVDDKNPA